MCYFFNNFQNQKKKNRDWTGRFVLQKRKTMKTIHIKDLIGPAYFFHWIAHIFVNDVIIKVPKNKYISSKYRHFRSYFNTTVEKQRIFFIFSRKCREKIISPRKPTVVSILKPTKSETAVIICRRQISSSCQ